MKKKTRTPNQIGDEFEARVERALGGKRVAQSGAGKFFKLDVRDKGLFIFSCKATEKDYIRITTNMLEEASRAARGPKGTGDGFKPAMAIEIAGQAYVLTKLEDYADLVTNDEMRYRQPTKGEARRAKARQTSMSRK